MQIGCKMTELEAFVLRTLVMGHPVFCKKMIVSAEYFCLQSIFWMLKMSRAIQSHICDILNVKWSVIDVCIVSWSACISVRDHQYHPAQSISSLMRTR